MSRDMCEHGFDQSEHLCVECECPTLRTELAACSPEQRLQFFREITTGYCTACGDRLGEQFVCHCENDE